MATHLVKTSFNKGMSFSSDIDGHKVITDNPEEGPGDGPSPKRLMLAALTGCTGIDVVSILNKMKVPFSDLQISAEGTLGETEPKIYVAVHIIYTIRLAVKDQLKMEKAVKLSLEKYCGVSAMFHYFAKESHEIIYL